ncbi:MAG: hypothetical protein WCS85_05020 [Candidatus Peribacteraceae bacterium]|jgi:hypothetical protein
MTIAQFTQGLQGLAYVPEAECSRAIAIAKLLPDKDRQEFFRHLESLNVQMGEMTKAQEEFLTAGETLVTETEHAIVRIGREEQEGRERAREMQGIGDDTFFSQTP